MPKDRQIPATMATQHPDNASAPVWKTDPFMSTQEEIEECYLAYSKLGCTEYMWDWEGKYVDEAVVDKLFSNYMDFFKEKKLGRDLFLTFRLPNIWLEKGYRLARAYMGIITYDDLAQDLGFTDPPVFEVILPMTDDADKMIHLQQTFANVVKLKKEIFQEKRRSLESVNVIPLIEDIPHMTGAGHILNDYIDAHKKVFKVEPAYLRPFIARSDPALNSGLVAATIAAKIAISECYIIEQQRGIPVYPIIGVGSLPFRGGLNPRRVDDFIRQYKGVRTVTIQSAFRYDYPEEEVSVGVEILNEELSSSQPEIHDADITRTGRQLASIFEKHYKKTVEEIADMVNELSKIVPKRRERMLHIGLFGYARGIAGKRLPRAISFTAALYSVGVPPELLGMGRGLKEVLQLNLMDELMYLYPNLKADILNAGYYINKETLDLLIDDNPAWKDVKMDILLIENLLDMELGPKDVSHFVHRNLVSSIYLLWRNGMDVSSQFLEAAILRKSIG